MHVRARQNHETQDRYPFPSLGSARRLEAYAVIYGTIVNRGARSLSSHKTQRIRSLPQAEQECGVTPPGAGSRPAHLRVEMKEDYLGE